MTHGDYKALERFLKRPSTMVALAIWLIGFVWFLYELSKVI